MSDIKVSERPKAPPQQNRGRVVPVADSIELKDEGMHARWAWDDPKSKRSMRRISDLKRIGYRAATEADVQDMTGTETEPDGTIHRGDQVLMVCAREGVEARELTARRERTAVERGQVKSIERGANIETEDELHHQRVRGKEVDLA